MLKGVAKPYETERSICCTRIIFKENNRRILKLDLLLFIIKELFVLIDPYIKF